MYPCCAQAAFLVHALAEAFQELCIVLQGRMLRVLKVETLHSPAHVRRPLLHTRALVLSQLPLQERPVALGILYKSANRSTAQWRNSHHALCAPSPSLAATPCTALTVHDSQKMYCMHDAWKAWKTVTGRKHTHRRDAKDHGHIEAHLCNKMQWASTHWPALQYCRPHARLGTHCTYPGYPHSESAAGALPCSWICIWTGEAPPHRCTDCGTDPCILNSTVNCCRFAAD